MSVTQKLGRRVKNRLQIPNQHRQISLLKKKKDPIFNALKSNHEHIGIYVPIVRKTLHITNTLVTLHITNR